MSELSRLYAGVTGERTVVVHVRPPAVCASSPRCFCVPATVDHQPDI
jgi:hypothetical protein